MSPLLIPALAALPEAFCRVEEQAQRVRLQDMLCSDLDECLHSQSPAEAELPEAPC